MKKQQHLLLFQFLSWLVFELPIVFSWQSLTYLDLGSNLLEGPVPSSICNSQNLQILVLANNKLSGTIPKCLGNFSSGLTALDLRYNDFHGTIPEYFSKDSNLKNLGLNGNHLEGPLPPSIKHCKHLEVLDVGNNKISDTFPMWLDSLPELHVLILRSNGFHGTIGTTKSRFKKLRIMDLSSNNFSGTLPAELLKNLPAMISVDGETKLEYMAEGNGSYYLDSVTLVLKGQEMEIKRVLSILTAIDLSGNKFEGAIPESIGNLSALKLLNLSHNNFSGSIPPALGRLNALESLDLSWNQFKGEIPRQLSNLLYLGKFNVSQNQLSGRIPDGNHFDTRFSIDSYYGNLGLCGFPLDACKAKETGQSPPPRSIFQETDCLGLRDGFTWQSVVLGYGFGMFTGLAAGGLMFYTAKPKWMLKIVEEIRKQLGIKTKNKRYIMIAEVY